MSFEELTERISPKLKGIVFKIHGSSPSFSAEDLYQEAADDLEGFWGRLAGELHWFKPFEKVL